MPQRREIYNESNDDIHNIAHIDMDNFIQAVFLWAVMQWAGSHFAAITIDVFATSSIFLKPTFIAINDADGLPILCSFHWMVSHRDAEYQRWYCVVFIELNYAHRQAWAHITIIARRHLRWAVAILISELSL